MTTKTELNEGVERASSSGLKSGPAGFGTLA